jgi:endonuclease/exonuclease/phosphatase family metal-dependent hydrolase
VTVVAFATITVLGLAGQVIRDRSVSMAILMYLPLLPAGLTAVALDLVRSGRAFPRGRFALTLLGLVASTWAALPMIGDGAVSEARPNDEEVSLLHWNVQWGGGLFRSQKTWAAQRFEILQREPDLVILSELPPDNGVEQLVSQLGPSADWVGIRHDPRSPYWLRLAVCSRRPIHLEQRHPLPGGVAMSVTAEVRGRPVRLLVVDGQSNPFRSRLPFLRAIAEVCQNSADAGHPIDAVVGDFNTLSRSIGFDTLTNQGFTLASRSASGWRGTFPSWLPLYDIDHVWLGPALRVRSCTLFNGPASDHRGQFVRILISGSGGKGT